MSACPECGGPIYPSGCVHAAWCRTWVLDEPKGASMSDDPERIAQAFHEAYERLAPEYGYETRRDSAVPWSEVPEQNRRLMIATVTEALGLAPPPKRTYTYTVQITIDELYGAEARKVCDDIGERLGELAAEYSHPDHIPVVILQREKP